MLFTSGVLDIWKIRLVLIASLLISVSTPTSLAVAAPPQQTDSVRELWLDISLGQPLVNWFNQVARPDDIARVERVDQISLLDEISTGRKLVVFRSIAEAERALPHIADRIDIIGYNLETGPNNHFEEKANPVDSVKRMHDLAREYDLLLAFGPDHELANSNGVEVAPYVDIFVLQIQRVQTEPARVSSFVWPLIPQLRQANPDLEISVQVRTEGDVDRIVDLIDAMNSQLDGVSILTSPETVDVAEALVNELQTRQDVIPSRPTVAPPVSRPAKQVEPVIAPAPSENSVEDTDLSCPLMILAAFIAGGIGGGVATALILQARKGAGRTTKQRL